MIEYVKALWADAEPFQWLVDRGLDPADIEHFELGYDKVKRAIYIPYVISNVEVYHRRRLLYPIGGLKYLGPKGPPVHLYNVDALHDAKHVYVTEGEFDCMILRKYGMDAVGVPGAGGFKKPWRWLFRDAETVTVCFDADAAGDRGSARIKAWIGDVCDDVRTLPMPEGVPEKTDINDLHLMGRLAEVLRD